MKNKIKCPRCGKEEIINVKNVKEIVECSHCHKKMIFTKKTNNIITIFKYLLVFVMATILMFSMQLFEIENTILYLISILLMSFILAVVSESICVKLVCATIGVEYQEYIEIKEEKKNKNNNKKSLFKR